MKPAVLVTPLSQEIPHVDHADYIGVDAGCLQILEQGFPLAFGVGDFDSMDPKMLEKLKQRASLTIHPVQKDETDSELALRLCQEKGYSPLLLMGGGKRKPGKTEISRFSMVQKEFEKKLRETLRKLFDLSVPFEQCKDAKYCTYCDFKKICRR